MKIILGVTGSVAAVLTPKLTTRLIENGNEVAIVATERSLHFWNPSDIKPENLFVAVFRDGDEWRDTRYTKGDHVPHIDLRDWADILLIAPLSANTLAKLAHGLADNLLTSVARAWDTKKPIIAAPAMNTFMWEHPATAEQLAMLKRWHPKLIIVPPISKMLACGTEGMGAMADIETIAEAAEKGGLSCAP